MVKKKLLVIFLVLISGIFSYVLFMDLLFFYTASLFRDFYTYFHGEYWVPLTCMALMTLFLSTFLYQLIIKEFSKKWVTTFFVIYGILLVYFLLFKSIGVRGMSLNPFSLLIDLIKGDPFVVLINIILFIPIGFILKLNKKNALLVIVSILIVEISQYLFSLGIFDVGDILANFTGYLIGNLIAETKWFQKGITSRMV